MTPQLAALKERREKETARGKREMHPYPHDFFLDALLSFCPRSSPTQRPPRTKKGGTRTYSLVRVSLRVNMHANTVIQTLRPVVVWHYAIAVDIKREGRNSYFISRSSLSSIFC